MRTIKEPGHYCRILPGGGTYRTDDRRCEFQKESIQGPDVEQGELSHHELVSLDSHVEESLLDKGHLSRLWRFIHGHMLAGFQKICERIDIVFTSDKIFSADKSVINERRIHIGS